MPATKPQNPANGAGLLLILTLVFLGISIWQTANGYELMFGAHLAWIFSLAIGLMMLFLVFQIRKRRLTGDDITGPMIGYVACAIFCFFGNFNAIYSRYNRDELFKKELVKHKEELTSIVTASNVALQRVDSSTSDLKTRVEQLKGQLILQINDPANQGVGTRAREIISQLEAVLGQPLTPFNGTADQLTKSYTSNIDHLLDARLSTSRKARAEQLISQNLATQDSVNKLILDAVKPRNISTKGQDAIFTAVDAINDIGARTDNFLGGKSFPYEKADFENQEIGKISHTFSSAFNGHNWPAAVICLLVAIAIDALVPFVILVGTKRAGQTEMVYNGQYRGKRKSTRPEVL